MHKGQVVLVGLAAVIVIAAIPAALRDTIDSGRIYLFSREFLQDLPERFTGPGRARFIIQPLMAILIGVGGGLRDAREGAPPYLLGMFLDRRRRAESIRRGLAATLNLLSIGIILDAVFQLVLYGVVHPAPAVVVGCVLIGVPYAASRSLANRVAAWCRRGGEHR